MLGDPAGQTIEQVPDSCSRGSNSNNTRKSNQTAWKTLCMMTGKKKHIPCREASGRMAEKDQQVWLAWKIKVLDLATRLASKIYVASYCV